MQVHPAFRKLTEVEMSEVEPFLTENCRVDRIKSFVLNRCGKHLTTKDVCNMRRNYDVGGLPQCNTMWLSGYCFNRSLE